MTAGIGPLTGGGADIDDVGSGACFDQRWQQGMGHINHPGDVGVDHGMQVGQLDLLHGRWRQCQAGIVDQRMDLPKIGGQRGNRLCHRFGILDIQFQGMHRGHGSKLVGQGVQAFFPAAADNNGPAVGGKPPGRGGAKAGGCTGDKQGFAQGILLVIGIVSGPCRAGSGAFFPDKGCPQGARLAVAVPL